MMQVKKLYRSETDQILGGVCAGIAEYLSIDPTIVRLVWVAIALIGGTGVFVYIILWIIIPTPKQEGLSAEKRIEENAEALGVKAEKFAKKVETEVDKTDLNRRRQLFGLIVILIGLWLLASTLGLTSWFNFGKFWPLILVAVGITLLFKKNE